MFCNDAQVSVCQSFKSQTAVNDLLLQDDAFLSNYFSAQCYCSQTWEIQNGHQKWRVVLAFHSCSNVSSFLYRFLDTVRPDPAGPVRGWKWQQLIYQSPLRMERLNSTPLCC